MLALNFVIAPAYLFLLFFSIFVDGLWSIFILSVGILWFLHTVNALSEDWKARYLPLYWVVLFGTPILAW